MCSWVLCSTSCVLSPLLGGSDPLWLEFQTMAIQSEGGSYIVDGDNVLSAEQHRRLHKERSFTVRWGAFLCPLVLFVFGASLVDGYRVMVSVPELFTGLQFSDHVKASSRWYQPPWGGWEKRLAKLGLSPNHLLRASRTIQSKKQDAAMILDDLDLRCLPTPSWSLPALLLLALRFINPRNDKSTEKATQQWSGLLSSMCSMLLPSSFLLPQGGPPGVDVTVHVTDGRVQLGETQRGTRLHQCLDGFEDEGVASPLLKVLAFVERQGVRCSALLVSWVHCIAVLMESSLVEEEREEGQTRRQGKKLLKLNAGLLKAAKASLQRSVNEMLIRYYFCMRSFFDRPGQCIGLSVDASRLGGRSTLLGLVTQSANICAWVPPVVPSFKKVERRDV